MDGVGIVATLDAIQPVETCECGRPKSEHKFWNREEFRPLLVPGCALSTRPHAPDLNLGLLSTTLVL